MKGSSLEGFSKLSDAKIGQVVKVFPRGGGVIPFNSTVLGPSKGPDNNQNIAVKKVVVTENTPWLDVFGIPRRQQTITRLLVNTPVKLEE